MKNNVFVNYQMGTSGMFIVGLLLTMEYGDNPEIIEKMKELGITESGSCHDLYDVLYEVLGWEPSNANANVKSFDERNFLMIPTYFDDTDNKMTGMREQTHKGNPFVDDESEEIDDWWTNSDFLRFLTMKTDENALVKCHIYRNVHKLLDYLDGSIINIQSDETSEQRFTNWWYKVVIGEQDTWGGVKQLKTHFHNSPHSIDKISDVTNENINEILKRWSSWTKKVKKYNEEMVQKYPDNFFVLKLEDIYSDREKVLQLLEDVSGNKRTQLTLDYYDDYMNTQYDFSSINIINEEEKS